MGFVIALVVVALVACLVLGQVYAVVHAATTSDAAYRQVGHSKVAWILVAIFAPFGWLIYLLWLRPKLPGSGSTRVGGRSSTLAPEVTKRRASGGTATTDA